MEETLKEAVEKYFNENVSAPYCFEISQDNVEDAFLAGAK